MDVIKFIAVWETLTSTERGTIIVVGILGIAIVTIYWYLAKAQSDNWRLKKVIRSYEQTSETSQSQIMQHKQLVVPLRVSSERPHQNLGKPGLAERQTSSQTECRLPRQQIQQPKEAQSSLTKDNRPNLPCQSQQRRTESLNKIERRQ